MVSLNKTILIETKKYPKTGYLWGGKNSKLQDRKIDSVKANRQ